jgi:hypothetical protein
MLCSRLAAWVKGKKLINWTLALAMAWKAQAIPLCSLHLQS